jgi:hypothetical protein
MLCVQGSFLTVDNGIRTGTFMTNLNKNKSITKQIIKEVAPWTRVTFQKPKPHGQARNPPPFVELGG